MTALVWVAGAPLLAALAVAAVPAVCPAWRRTLALLGSGGALAALAVVGVSFDPVLWQVQQRARAPWMPAFGATWDVGVDGLSLPFLAAAGLGVFLTLVCRPPAAPDAATTGPALEVLLVCQASLAGLFMARDMLLLWLCWALYLTCCAFGVGAGGGSRGARAATRLGVSGAASLALLLGLFVSQAAAVKSLTGAWSFDYETWTHLMLPLSQQVRSLVCLLGALGVALPLLPVAAWWQDAHEAAPAAGAVMLVLGPGLYGLVRLAAPLFPLASFHALPAVGALAGATALVAACVAAFGGAFRDRLGWVALGQGALMVLGVTSLTAEGLLGALTLFVVATGAFIGLLSFETLRGARMPSAPEAPAAAPEAGRAGPRVALTFALALALVPGLGGFTAAVLTLSGVASADRSGRALEVTTPAYGVDPLWLLALGLLGAGGLGMALVRAVRALPSAAWAWPGRRGWPLAVWLAVLVALGLRPQPCLEGVRASLNRYQTDFSRRLQHAGLQPEAPAHLFPDARTPLAMARPPGPGTRPCPAAR